MEPIGPIARKVVRNALIPALLRHTTQMADQVRAYDRTRDVKHLAAYEAHAIAAQRLVHQAAKLDEARRG